MAEMLWSVDKMTPGELERRQAQYAREALEMARRSASLGISINVSAAGKIDIESVKTERITADESGMGEKEIITAIPKAETGERAVIPEKGMSSAVESGETELKRIVEERIVKTLDDERIERFGELSDLRRIIEREMSAFEGSVGEKSETLQDLKKIIDKELEVLGEEEKKAPGKKPGEVIDVRKAPRKPPKVNVEFRDNSCDYTDVRKRHEEQIHMGAHHKRVPCEGYGRAEGLFEKGEDISGKGSDGQQYKKKNPPNFQSYINRHNEGFEPPQGQRGKGGKKN